MKKIKINLKTLAFITLGIAGGLVPSPSPARFSALDFTGSTIEARCGVGSVYPSNDETRSLKQIRELAESSNHDMSHEDYFILYDNRCNDVGYKERLGACVANQEIIAKLDIRGSYIAVHPHPIGINGRKRIHSPVSAGDLKNGWLSDKYCDGRIGAMDSRGFWSTEAGNYLDTIDGASKKYKKLSTDFIDSQYKDGFNFEVEKDKFLRGARDLGFDIKYQDLYGKRPRGKALSRPKSNYKTRQIKK